MRILLKSSINLKFLKKEENHEKRVLGVISFVLIIVLQWIGLGFHGQIRFIFLIIILVLIVLFAILVRK